MAEEVERCWKEPKTVELLYRPVRADRFSLLAAPMMQEPLEARLTGGAAIARPAGTGETVRAARWCAETGLAAWTTSTAGPPAEVTQAT